MAFFCFMLRVFSKLGLRGFFVISCIPMKNKCILLDRDGVLNSERGDYVYNDADFVIEPGVPEGLVELKKAGFKLVVVTNQGGISKGLYTKETVLRYHSQIQKRCGYSLDFLLYAPLHKSMTKTLASKPGTLMLERGLALTESDPVQSWIIGDAERDLVAGKAVGVRTILIPTLKERESTYADFVVPDFATAVKTILG